MLNILSDVDGVLTHNCKYRFHTDRRDDYLKSAKAFNDHDSYIIEMMRLRNDLRSQVKIVLVSGDHHVNEKLCYSSRWIV